MVFKKAAAVRFFVPDGLLKIARQFIAGMFSAVPAGPPEGYGANISIC